MRKVDEFDKSSVIHQTKITQINLFAKTLLLPNVPTIWYTHSHLTVVVLAVVTVE